MLKGRCGCRTVTYEVPDEFLVAYLCHCSNCRAMTGSAFLPWGEIEREKLTITRGADSLLRLGPDGGDQEVRCAECRSLVYWTRDLVYARIPYGTLVDEPSLRPMAHMFVGSKAPWYEIRDELPQYDEYPW